MDSVEDPDEGRKAVVYGRQNSCHEGTVEQREGVKKSYQIKRKKRAHENKSENVVLLDRLVAFGPFWPEKLRFFKQKREALMDRTEGTHPAAGDSAQDKCQDNSNGCEGKGGKKSAGSDDCGQGEKRVEMEENLHPSDVIFTREMSSEQ